MRVKLPMGDVLRLGISRRPYRWFGLTFTPVGANWGTVRYLVGVRIGR